jgi:nitrogen fixation protein FixH
MTRELTGKGVLAITVSAFGVIIAVNALLAVQAVRTFPGLEVASSYVASQTFDADRTAQKALGWHLASSYDGKHLRLDLTDHAGQPVELATVTATIGRPTEASDDIILQITRKEGAYLAPVTLRPGRWVVFLEARAKIGTRYHKRLDLTVRG